METATFLQRQPVLSTRLMPPSYLAVRDVAKGEQVAKELLQSGKSHAKIEVLKLELDSLASVRSCAAEFQKRSRTLNILVNNAGQI